MTSFSSISEAVGKTTFISCCWNIEDNLWSSVHRQKHYDSPQNKQGKAEAASITNCLSLYWVMQQDLMADPNKQSENMKTTANNYQFLHGKWWSFPEGMPLGQPLLACRRHCIFLGWKLCFLAMRYGGILIVCESSDYCHCLPAIGFPSHQQSILLNQAHAQECGDK